MWAPRRQEEDETPFAERFAALQEQMGGAVSPRQRNFGDQSGAAGGGWGVSAFVPLADLCSKITKGTTPNAKDGGFADRE